MERQNPIGTARQLGEATLVKLLAIGVPPTPENYTVWHHDVAGSNPDLSKMLRLIEMQGRPYDKEVCAQLYQKFFGSDQQAKLIDETCARMETTITRMLAQMTSMSGGTNAYGQVLEGFQSQLSAPDDVQEIRILVEQVLHETLKMHDRTRTLEVALEESTKEIVAIGDHLLTAKKQAMTDGLTSIANRRCFDEELGRMIRDAEVDETPLSLLVGDIDHFKKFNDTYGHRVGDKVLQEVALILTQCIKGRDLAARYGGEEFAVLLPMTDLAGAAKVAEQIRTSIAKKKIRLKSSGQVLGAITMSLGATSYVCGEGAAALIERADDALYRAKREGRNRVVIQPPGLRSSAA